MNTPKFPLLENRQVVYLDSASSTQKPAAVLEAMTRYYENSYANTNRGAYQLGEDSTQCLEEGRRVVCRWLNAKREHEIIFTKGTTEAINLVATSLGAMDEIGPGDEIAVLISEHHANLLPWQRLCQQRGATLVYLYLDDTFCFSQQEIEQKINSKTKVVACALISNALGIANPVEEIIARAHAVGAKVVVDAAQAVAHRPIDVQALDADFVAFSGHKMYGPMGIGVLYGKQQWLDKMPPYLLGGDMVEYVYEQEVTFAPLPHKFEAGTQNVAGVVGLAAAIKVMEEIGFEAIRRHQKELMGYAMEKLSALPYIQVIGAQNPAREGIISFVVEGVHPHDVASILDSRGICMRAGNHCAQPLLRRLGVAATTRMSFGVYNTQQDIDTAIEGIQQAKEMFGKWT